MFNEFLDTIFLLEAMLVNLLILYIALRIFLNVFEIERKTYLKEDDVLFASHEVLHIVWLSDEIIVIQ